MRRLGRAVVDSVVRPLPSPLLADGITSVGIDIKAGKVRAGNVEADLMPGGKHIARRIEGNRQLGDLARR